MQYSQQILTKLRNTAPEQAELFEEEINIIIHKLKFLPDDSFPSVVVLSQQAAFAPLTSEGLYERIIIAGGKIVPEGESPQVVILIKEDDSIFSALPNLLEKAWLRAAPAYQENRIFIIDAQGFGSDDNFLRDTEILAEIVQPKYFYFGHEDILWSKFELV